MVKVNNIYPSFKDDLKCLKGLGNFKQGNKYLIDGFGVGKDNKKTKFDVWYIRSVKDKLNFVVKKETLIMMVDNKMIEIIY